MIFCHWLISQKYLSYVLLLQVICYYFSSILSHLWEWEADNTSDWNVRLSSLPMWDGDEKLGCLKTDELQHLPPAHTANQITRIHSYSQPQCRHQALWRSALSVECPDVKNFKWRFNPVWHGMFYSCTHMATVGVEGLKVIQRHWKHELTQNTQVPKLSFNSTSNYQSTGSTFLRCSKHGPNLVTTITSTNSIKCDKFWSNGIILQFRFDWLCVLRCFVALHRATSVTNEPQFFQQHIHIVRNRLAAKPQFSWLEVRMLHICVWWPAKKCIWAVLCLRGKCWYNADDDANNDNIQAQLSEGKSITIKLSMIVDYSVNGDDLFLWQLQILYKKLQAIYLMLYKR